MVRMVRRTPLHLSRRLAIRRLFMPVGLLMVLLLNAGCGGGTITVSFGGPGTPGNGGNSSITFGSGSNNNSGGNNNSSSSSNNSNGPAPQFGVQQKTSGCRPVNGLPDSACTPGAIFPDATVSQICQSGYSSSVRNVPTSEKGQVYAEYGISHHATGDFEVDHLVSLELGGSNDIANLWPEAALPKPGFHEKDKVENYLHDQVCSGAISLPDAQREIATNWLAVYQQMGGG